MEVRMLHSSGQVDPCGPLHLLVAGEAGHAPRASDSSTSSARSRLGAWCLPASSGLVEHHANHAFDVPWPETEPGHDVVGAAVTRK